MKTTTPILLFGQKTTHADRSFSDIGRLATGLSRGENYDSKDDHSWASFSTRNYTGTAHFMHHRVLLRSPSFRMQCEITPENAFTSIQVDHLFKSHAS